MRVEMNYDAISMDEWQHWLPLNRLEAVAKACSLTTNETLPHKKPRHRRGNNLVAALIMTIIQQ